MASLTQIRRYEYQQSFKDAGFAAGMAASADAARKMAAATQGAAESVAKVETETRRAAPAWTAVNKLIDSGAVLSAAKAKADAALEARLRSLREEALRNNEVAARAGTIERDLTAIRDRAVAKAEALAAANRNLNASAGASSGAFAGMRGQLSNVSFQLQDIAVQAQAGTNALTILGQQGPQLLGGFGPAGAIAGAVIAVGALAAGMLGLATKTVTLDDAIKGVDANYQRMNDAATARIEGIKKEVEAVETLRGAYVAMGTASQRAEELARAQAQKTLDSQAGSLLDRVGGSLGGRVQTQEQGSQVFDALGNATGAFTGAGTGPGLAAGIQAAVDAFIKLRDVTGPTVDGVRAFAVALDDAAKSDAASATELRHLRDDALTALPQFAALEAAYKQNAVQSVAMRLAAGESAESIIASANAAQGSAGRYAGLTAEIVKTAAALNQLRRNAVDDPLAAVNAEASRLADQLAALNAGGVEALNRVKSGQEQQIATTKRLNEITAEYIKTQQQLGKTEAEAIALADARRPQWERDIGAALDLNTQLVVRTKQVQDAQAAASKAGTEAASAARKVAAEEERAAKKALDDANKLQSSFDKLWADADKKAEERVAKADAAERTQAQSLERIQLETKLVGESTATREREIAVLGERQKILAENAGNESAIDMESSRRRLARAGEIATETSALTRQRSAMQELSSIGERAFETIGTAITTAFVQGKGAAVNFGTVAKGVVAQLAAEILKLAVLRPIMNALFATDYATIANVGSALGGASSGGASSGGTGSGGLFSNFSSLSSIGNAFSGGASGGFGATIDSYGVSSGLFGNGISPLAEGPTLSGAPLGATSQSGLFGTASATSSLGGISGGIGLGMLGGSLVGGARGSVNATQNAMIGSVAGAGIGFLVGGPVGALVGGAIGGTGSGFFGPTKKGMESRSGGDVAYGNWGGQLQIIGGGGKRTDMAANYAEVQAQLDKLNAAIAQRGLLLTGGTGMVGFGKASRNPTSVDTNIGGLLSSTDANVQTAIDNRGGKNLEQLFGDIDWVQQVYNPLTKTADATNAFQKQLDALNAQFTPAIDRAASLGIATGDLSAKLAEATASLTAQRDAVVKSIQDTLTGRLARDRGDTVTADLIDFDTAAAKQRKDLTAQLADLGTSADTSASLLDQLGQALGLERQAILDSAAAAAAQAKATAEAAAAQAEATKAQEAAAAAAAAEQRAATLRQFDGSVSSRRQTGLGNGLMGALLAFDASAAEELASARKSFADLGLSAYEASIRLTDLAEVQALERANTVFESAKSDYITALQSNVGALQASVSVGQANTDALRGMAASLRTWLRSLAVSDQSPLTPQQRLEELRSQLGGALARAADPTLSATDRAGAGSQAQGLAQQTLTEAAAYYGRATAAYAAEYASVAGRVATLANTADAQADSAAAALEINRSQLETLQTSLAWAQDFGAKALGSLDDLKLAMVNALAALNGARAENGGTPLPGGTGTPIDSVSAMITSWYRTNLNRAPEAGIVDAWAGQLQSRTVSDVLSQFLAGAKLERGYAAGGLAASGWNLVGEAGPELVNFASPGRVYTAQETRAALGANAGNSSIAEELRALRAEVAELRRVTAQGATAVQQEVAAGNAMQGRSATADRLKVARA